MMLAVMWAAREPLLQDSRVESKGGKGEGGKGAVSVRKRRGRKGKEEGI